MSKRRKERLLSITEAAQRPFKSVRLAASTSFGESEVEVLDKLLACLRRGGDPKIIMRAPELANISRKVETMKQTLVRQRERREVKTSGASEGMRRLMEACATREELERVVVHFTLDNSPDAVPREEILTVHREVEIAKGWRP